MARSCVVVLILGVLTLGATGYADTTNSVAVDEAVNSTSIQPPSPPVLLFLLNLPRNETSGNGTATGVSEGNSSGIPEPQAVLLITALEVLAANGTEDGSDTRALPGNPVKRMTEEPLTRARRFADSEARLIRRKRTLSKHTKGCGVMCKMFKMYQQQPTCNTCQTPPPQQNYCGSCQQPKQQQYYNPCGGHGCGGSQHPGGSYSQSSSQSSSMSASWGH